MEKQKSLVKIEQEIRRSFRKDLSVAESTLDIKKFFTAAVQKLFAKVFDEEIRIDFDDIRLNDAAESGFLLNPDLKGDVAFRRHWDSTELPAIIGRLAENANHHIGHLEKNNPHKTEMKIFPTPSHAGRFHKNIQVKR
jgi:hypothetical protein